MLLFRDVGEHWIFILHCSGWVICNLITSMLRRILNLLVMPSMLLKTTLLNLGVLSYHVDFFLVLSLPNLGWSLLGDKQTGSLILLQERSHY